MNKDSLFNLNGKTAIVTGGAKGIGKACCEILAAFGARVVVSDYDIEAAEKTAEEITKNGSVAMALKCDNTKDEDLVHLVEETADKFGSIEILVNNVGGGGAGRESPYDIEVAQFKKVFEMNVF